MLSSWRYGIRVPNFEEFLLLLGSEVVVEIASVPEPRQPDWNTLELGR